MSSDMHTERPNNPTNSPTRGPTSGPIPFTAVLMATGMIFSAAVATVSAQGVAPTPTITGPIPATTPFGDPSDAVQWIWRISNEEYEASVRASLEVFARDFSELLEQRDTPLNRLAQRLLLTR